MSISFIYLYRVTKLFLYCLKVSWVCLMKKKDWRGNKYKVEGVRWNYHISNMNYLPKSFTIVKYFKEAHKAHIVWRENHMTLRKTYNKIRIYGRQKCFHWCQKMKPDYFFSKLSEWIRFFKSKAFMLKYKATKILSARNVNFVK